MLENPWADLERQKGREAEKGSEEQMEQDGHGEGNGEFMQKTLSDSMIPQVSETIINSNEVSPDRATAHNQRVGTRFVPLIFMRLY